MLCVRCKHELPPRADRCLRCFALNPQNRAETPAPPATPPAPAQAAARPAPASGRTAPAPGKRAPAPAKGAAASGKLARAPAQAALLAIDSDPPPAAPAVGALSIASDPPPAGGLQLSLDSEPPAAPVALDFGSDPEPPAPAEEDAAADPGSDLPLAAPPLGLPRDGLGRVRAKQTQQAPEPRSTADDLHQAPAWRVASDPPKQGPRFDEIPADAIDELQIAARDPAFSELPTEPPTVPPPEGPASEEERLRERLRQAASDHDWGAPPPEAPPFRPPPWAANAPPFVSARTPVPPPSEPAPQLPLPQPRPPPAPVETTPGWLAALATDRSLPPPEPPDAWSAAVPAPAPERPSARPPIAVAAREDADTERELAPAGARAAQPGPAFGSGDDVSEVPFAPTVDSLEPAPPPARDPAGPQRPAASLRLASWLLDAAVISACCALFVALAAALLGQPRLAPLGAQSPESWADLMLFGRRLPLLWTLLAGALGVAYSWLFGALGGRTPGQRLAGLRLRRLDGGLPDPVQALLHAALALPSLALGLFGFLLAFVDPRGQTLHDKLSGTVVEQEPAAG